MSKKFLELVKIPSPSGQEKCVADFIVKFFQNLKWKVKIYGNGSANNANTGNVVSWLPGGAVRVLFVAHMDTVQEIGSLVKPLFNGYVFRSDGSAILGADNKAGVAILLSLAVLLNAMDVKPTVYMAFTTREEAGLPGSSLIPIKKINPNYIINLDGGKTPGSIAYKALGQAVFEIKIKGRMSHAASNPQAGIHAIKIAADFITSIKMGKFRNGDCCNIGLIQGGRSTNIIPDYVSLQGEVRSFNVKRLEKNLNSIEHKIASFCSPCGAKYDFIVDKNQGMPVFEGIKNSVFMRIIEKACNKSKLNYKPISMYGSSDANILAGYGKPTVCINRGGSNEHSNLESIELKEMSDTLILLEQLTIILQKRF